MSVARFNLSAWALAHPSFTRFVAILLMAAGILAFFKLGQKEDPDFTFRVMVVQSQWPGATTEEVQNQVTARLERKLQEVPYLDFTRSSSRPGESLIFVNLRQDVPPKQVADIWYQVRKKIGDIRVTLPAGVQGPFFNDEFGDTYSAIYALTGDGFGYDALKDQADSLRDALLRVRGVEKVDLIGEQAKRLYVTVSNRRLAQLGLDIDAILRAVGGQNEIEPAGTISTAERDVRVRVAGGLDRIEELRDVRLRAGEATIRLGDIAEISRGYVDPPVFRMRFKGRDALGLGVVMARDGNVVDLGPRLDAAIAAVRVDMPLGLVIDKVSDQPQIVARYIGEFLTSLLEAIAIVLAVSFLSLGWRTGIVVALTIPLVLAITFLAMDFFGIALQKISLGALIIALGLLVDDAMIAVEMMARKLEEGMDRFAAASYAYTSTAMPMLTGTLITVAGFLPVGLAKSTAGEYTFSIFAVVGIALVVSWFAAVFFTPYLGFVLLRERKSHTPHDVFDTRFYRGFRALVEACLRHRWLVIGATLGLFALGIAGLGLVPKQFFPASNRAEAMVELWSPEGTGFAASDASAQRLEAVLAGNPDILHVTSYVGAGSPRFYLPLDQQLQSANFAQLVVLASDLEARERVIARIRADLADNAPGVRARVDRLNSGPPVGWPIQFRIRGEDPGVLRVFAEETKTLVREHPATFDVHDDWREAIPVLRIVIDQDRARALGLSSQTLRRTLAGITNGVPIGGYREDDGVIPILLRAPLDERATLEALGQVYVRAANGASVPLSQIARLMPASEAGIVWRRNRMPTITVLANVPDSVQPPDVAKALDAAMAPLRARLPAGYTIEAGGAVEESAKSQASIFVNLPLVAVATMLLLMVQLQHFGRALLVFLTAPLGIVGAAGALLVFGLPFGFTAILGVIALSGMIMRNAVILVDQVEREIAAGRDAWSAIVESTVARFRPIMLTAAAAILALIPLTRNVFWGPMSVAMMGGLIVATLLTVTFLPALYATWFRVRQAAPATAAPVTAGLPSGVGPLAAE